MTVICEETGFIAREVTLSSFKINHVRVFYLSPQNNCNFFFSPDLDRLGVKSKNNVSHTVKIEVIWTTPLFNFKHLRESFQQSRRVEH